MQHGRQTRKEFAHIIYQSKYLAKLLHICRSGHFGDGLHFAAVWFHTIRADNVSEELEFSDTLLC